MSEKFKVRMSELSKMSEMSEMSEIILSYFEVFL